MTTTETGYASDLLRRILVDHETISDQLADYNGTNLLPDGQLDPKWLMLAQSLQAKAAKAYLLAVLQQVAPGVADPVAAWLDMAAEDGQPLDELAWEMREKLTAGQPPHLPGVPS